MKALKILAPILVALVIVLCLSFSFLSILRVPISNWHQDNLERYYNEFLDSIFSNLNRSASSTLDDSSSSSTDTNTTDNWIKAEKVENSDSITILRPTIQTDANTAFQIVVTPADSTVSQQSYSAHASNALEFAYFPLLGIILGDHFTTLFNIFATCVIPAVIIFISVIILALYFALLKNKGSICTSGRLGKAARIFSILTNTVGIIASVFICLFSIPTVVQCVKSLVKSFTEDYDAMIHISGIILALVELLISLASIGVFFLIALSLTVFLIITVKSKQTTDMPNKKALKAACFVSVFGTIVSLFITLHFAITQMFSFVNLAISIINSGISSYIIYPIDQVLIILSLLVLAASITVGFIIALSKVIASLKKTSNKIYSAYNGNTPSMIDIFDEGSDII